MFDGRCFVFLDTAAYQTCLMPGMRTTLTVSGLYQLFDLCLIKHVLTVWPNISRLSRPLGHGQTQNVCQPNTIKHCLVTKHFTVWTPCLGLLDRAWSCWYNLKAIKHSIKYLKYFFRCRVVVLLFLLLMSDVWTAAYQTCLKWACVPRLLSKQLFGDQTVKTCLIKHKTNNWYN